MGRKGREHRQTGVWRKRLPGDEATIESLLAIGLGGSGKAQEHVASHMGQAHLLSSGGWDGAGEQGERMKVPDEETGMRCTW